MGTYEELLRLLRTLPPDIRRLLELILNSGPPLPPGLLVDVLRRLIEGTPHGDTIWRCLILLARLGRLTPATLAALMAQLNSLAAGGATTVTVTEGGIAGGAGVGGIAISTVLAFLAALLAAVLAIYTAYVSISTELATEYPDLGGWMPCPQLTPDSIAIAQAVREESAWGIGSRTARNRAIARARTACAADSARCQGVSCASGGACQPFVSIIDIDYTYAIFATRASVRFRCYCGCPAP